MGFKCGIVGLPNVGKSTLFNALTKAGIEAANYPFCTIEPNVGIVDVPDPRLTQIASIANSKNVIPTTVKFVDIAGLVAGAAKGEGLGNKFLANIRETNAIAHVVRCFEGDVTHVSGVVDPVADVETIHTELMLADIETIDRAILKQQKDARRGDKAAKLAVATLTLVKEHLNLGRSLRNLELTETQILHVQGLQLLSLKPVLYVANIDDTGSCDNHHLERLVKYARQENAQVVAISANIEAEIAELTIAEQKEFLNSLGLTEPGLNRVIRAGYDLLDLETFFTVGPKEARAWTITKNAKAPEAAGVIHTDFEKGFIRAEVIGFSDYINYQGEAGAKDAGKWRLEGKDYIVQDGDVVLFRFNV